MSPPERPLALPRGVASPDGTLGFVRNRRGDIDALRLDSGTLLWRGGVAAEPVAATDREVIAVRPSPGRSNALDLLVLSVADAGRVARECRIELPEGVMAASSDPRDFQSWVELEGGTLRLEWKARSRYRAGAPPPAAVARAARVEVRGAARCDIERGAVTTEPSPGAQAEDLPPSLPYRIRSVWSQSAWSYGAGVASLALAGPTDGRKLVLELRAAAASAPRVIELLPGDAFDVHVTPEGRYVFARPSRHQGSSEWSVFATATGGRVSSLPHQEGFQWPCVVGGRAYYLLTGPTVGTGLLLESADLQAAQALWRHDLGGPVPSPPSLAR